MTKDTQLNSVSYHFQARRNMLRQLGFVPTISISFQSGSRLRSSHKFFPTWFENIPLGLIFNSKIRLKIITISKVGCIIDALVHFWSIKTSMRSWSLKVHISQTFFYKKALYSEKLYFFRHLKMNLLWNNCVTVIFKVVCIRLWHLQL